MGSNKKLKGKDVISNPYAANISEKRSKSTMRNAKQNLNVIIFNACREHILIQTLEICIRQSINLILLLFLIKMTITLFTTKK